VRCPTPRQRLGRGSLRQGVVEVEVRLHLVVEAEVDRRQLRRDQLVLA
jgi:hypothetical protein